MFIKTRELIFRGFSREPQKISLIFHQILYNKKTIYVNGRIIQLSIAMEQQRKLKFIFRQQIDIPRNKCYATYKYKAKYSHKGIKTYQY